MKTPLNQAAPTQAVKPLPELENGLMSRLKSRRQEMEQVLEQNAGMENRQTASLSQS